MAGVFGERSSQSATAPEGGHTKKRKGRQGGRRERPGGGQCRRSADLPWNNERRSIVRNVTAGRRDDDAENHAAAPEAGCLADRLAGCALRNWRRATFQDPARPRRTRELLAAARDMRRAQESLLSSCRRGIVRFTGHDWRFFAVAGRGIRTAFSRNVAGASAERGRAACVRGMT